MRARILAALALVTGTYACGLDPDEPSTETAVEQDLTTTSWAYIYPAGSGGYYISGLVGNVDCVSGAGGTCHADTIDFSLMPELDATRISELRQRIATSDSNRADISLVVEGQWRTVTVHDNRTNPPRTYQRIDFQVTKAYEGSTANTPHVTTFFQLYGTTYQRAQGISLQHTLPFTTTVQFPGPVLVNQYGVVPDAIITGTITQAPTTTTPAHIVADQFMGRI